MSMQMLAGCFLAASALLACRDQGIDLDRLLDLHAEARGGRKALEAVNSLQVRLHLVEPGFEADLVYRAMRPGYARVDVTVGGQVVFTEGVDDSGAWQQAGSERAPERASPEGTGALRRGAIGNLYGLHELQGLGYRISLREPAEIDGTLYHMLEVTAPDGDTVLRYLDRVTCLVTRGRTVKAVHPDIDPTERRIESRFSDFRTVAGTVHSFQSEDRDIDTGELLGQTVITHVGINPPLDASFFAMPREGAGR